MSAEAKLFDEAIAAIKFSEFFERHGCKPQGSPDESGWVTTLNCFAPGSFMRANFITGEWSDEEHNRAGQILDFIMCTMKLKDDEQGRLAALQALCAACGLSEKFERSQYERTGPVLAESHVIKWSRAISTTEVGIARYDDFYRKTGIRLSTVQHYNIGFADSNTPGIGGPCWVIPIPDDQGIYRSARIADEKLSCHWPTAGKIFKRLDRTAKLFGIDEMLRGVWRTVIICHNELDRIRMMQERESNDIGSISLTDLQYLRRFNAHFEGMRIVLCFPSDEDSQSYANSVIAPILHELKRDRRIASLKSIALPAPIAEEVTFCHWMQAGGSWMDFMARVAAAPEWASSVNALTSEPVHTLNSFGEIDDPINLDRKVQVKLQITGETSTTYDTPAEFAVDYCEKIQSGKCMICEDRVFQIPAGHQSHIGICGMGEKESLRACQQICCQFGYRPRIGVKSKYTFRQMIASDYRPLMVISKDNPDRSNVERFIYVRVPEGSSAIPDPRGYLATGWVRTNPTNSQRTMLVESLEKINEGHEAFKTEDHLTQLEKMRAVGWQGIVKDITEYRTRVYGKDEILLISLLTYCSPLHINFNGETVRGWLTSAVVGETGAGKSKAFEMVSKMVGVGNMFSCQTGSRTGLTYALVYNGSRWQCNAGLFPRSSGCILAIEEVQDASYEELKSIGIAMDTGVLSVEKSARGSYETKTRLLVNGNPPKGVSLSSYRYGCQVFRDLLPYMVIRRIDIGVVIRRPEDNATFNKKWSPQSPPNVLPGDLQALVFYAWNLTADRIVLSDEVTNSILAAAKSMGDSFGPAADDIPLVCPTDVRFTIARLATAWAVLGLSTTDGFKTITVTPEHVDLAVKFLYGIYTSPECALDHYSDYCAQVNRLDDYSSIANEFDKRIKSKKWASFEGKHPFVNVVALLQTGRLYTPAELARIAKVTPAQLGEMIDFMHGSSLLRKSAESIQASNKFTRFMERYQRSNPIAYAMLAAAEDRPGKEETRDE